MAVEVAEVVEAITADGGAETLRGSEPLAPSLAEAVPVAEAGPVADSGDVALAEAGPVADSGDVAVVEMGGDFGTSDDLESAIAAVGRESDEEAWGEDLDSEFVRTLEGEGEVDEESGIAPTEALIGDGAAEEDGTVADTRAYLKGLVEAILFVSDRPLQTKEVARAARIDKRRTQELIDELRAERGSSGVRLDEVAGGYAFRSHPRYATYLRGFLAQRPVRLSRAQLETLAIIAYRQPITRPEVDDIRGVDTGPVLKGLLERDLIRILGKKDEPGRPMLYGTTTAFLELFSLQSLRELPTLREFTELSEDSRRKFEDELGEEAPDGPVDLSGTVPEAVGTIEELESEGADDSLASGEEGSDSVPPAKEPPADEDDADEDDADEDDADEDDADEDDADE
ncbi:MAG: SMC-Scp complex subunit ScpB, partial [Polyangiaceae bacterium]|nr:SMC-Scp complex subunit ScpB [Polyangiaceae bacterium]